MKKIILFLLAVMACLAYVRRSEAVEPVFFANFDKGGIPNEGVNDPKNWKPQNPALIWGIGDFPANGTKALQMMASGCGTSGFTPLPGLERWSDGIIQMDMGWRDDDSWGIVFRWDGESNGYFVFFGFEETINLALFDLAQLGLKNAQCLSQVPGAEQGPEPGAKIKEDAPGLLKVVPHNLPIDKTANTSYTGRIMAQGPKIKIWYGLTKDFPDDPLKEPQNVSAVIEVEDSTYSEGMIGIWHESNDNSVVDNIYVFDQKALSVAPSREKMATVWGRLKAW